MFKEEQATQYESQDENNLVGLLRKQNSLLRTILILMAVFTLILIITIATILPKAVTLMKSAETTITNLNEISSQLADSDLSGVLEETQAFLEAAEEGIDTTTSTLGSIDLNALNKAISDLQTAVAPLASLFR